MAESVPRLEFIIFENAIATAGKNCFSLKKMSQEVLIAEGEFVFPNGDEYRGSYISTENGIQMHGAGVLTSKQVHL